MNQSSRHFSALARRTSEPPISWLMRLALERRDLISLAAGFTDNETLPVEEVATLTREILSKPKTARAALQYGTTIGLPQLRHELLRRWQTQDGIEPKQITTEDVVATNGSQQLLYLISEVLCDPGDLVLVEDPTYFVYLGIIGAAGIRAVAAVCRPDPSASPGDECDRRDTLPGAHRAPLHGLVDALECLKTRRLLPRLKLLYLVTYFQNPTGHTWSLDAKRKALAIVKHYERAAGHPIYIIEDAAYRDLRFEGEDVPSFKSLDPRNERVAYTNTLTKPFATGIKLGYGILPKPLMRAVLRSKGNHDFGSSNFLQTILARALAEGLYERHLPTIASAYRRKRDVMVAELDATFPKSARYQEPHGGLYVWVELDRRVRTGAKSRLFKHALDAGVLYVPGEMCYCNDPSRPVPQNCVRLSFGAPTVEQMRKGVQLLARALA